MVPANCPNVADNSWHYWSKEKSSHPVKHVDSIGFHTQFLIILTRSAWKSPQNVHGMLVQHRNFEFQALLTFHRKLFRIIQEGKNPFSNPSACATYHTAMSCVLLLSKPQPSSTRYKSFASHLSVQAVRCQCLPTWPQKPDWSTTIWWESNLTLLGKCSSVSGVIFLEWVYTDGFAVAAKGTHTDLYIYNHIYICTQVHSPVHINNKMQWVYRIPSGKLT